MQEKQNRKTRAARKKQDIMEAARRRFITDGYTGCGMEAVARDANVSTATLYAYFPGKAELFEAVLTEAVQAFAAGLREMGHEEGQAAAELGDFARAYAGFWADPESRALFRLMSAELRRLSGGAASFPDLAERSPANVLVRLIERLVAKGELERADAEIAASQFLGMLERPTLHRGLVRGDNAPPAWPIEVVSDEAVRTFLARYGRASDASQPPAQG